MSRALARALRARNVDVTTALEQDMIERSDAAHLDYATAQGRVLFSFNVGIEVGQLLIVAVALGLAWPLKKRLVDRPRLTRAMNMPTNGDQEIHQAQ